MLSDTCVPCRSNSIFDSMREWLPRQCDERSAPKTVISGYTTAMKLLAFTKGA